MEATPPIFVLDREGWLSVFESVAAAETRHDPSSCATCWPTRWQATTDWTRSSRGLAAVATCEPRAVAEVRAASGLT